MLAGFMTRPAALGLIVVMVVAIAKVHAQHGFFINFWERRARATAWSSTSR